MTFSPSTVVVALLAFISTVQPFQPSLVNKRCCHRDIVRCPKPLSMTSARNERGDDEENCGNTEIKNGRRSFVSSSGLSFLAVLSTQVSTPSPALAGIDVSALKSLPMEGGGKTVGSAAIADQLKQYDGSATTRLQQIKTTQESDAATKLASRDYQESGTAATSALRYSTVSTPRLTRLGVGERFQCDDLLLSPKGARLSVSFEFPSDWLQLDRALGGVQYVDQRNGDKLYILRAPLPAETSLATVPKQWFGDAIFDQQGAIVKGGVGIDEYKVSSSTVLSDGSYAAAHRRLSIKYATLTGNGYRVERRALVDSYEIDSVAYMLVTSSNAVKFDAKGKERDTVESIVDSFRLEKA